MIRDAVGAQAGPPRERLLDVIRGFALCGILLININALGDGYLTQYPREPFSLASLDWQAFVLSDLFVEGTMRGLFTILFGASALLAFQASGRGEAAGLALHYRRAVALVALGLAHAHLFLWYGDILFLYGLAALFLFPLRRLPPVSKLALASVLIGVLAVTGALFTIGQAEAFRAGEAAIVAQAAGGELSQAQAQALEARNEALDLRRPPLSALNEERQARLGDYVDVMRLNSAEWARFNLGSPLLIFLIESIAFMLIGMALLESGILTGRRAPSFYQWLAVCGYGLGAGLSAVELWIGARTDFEPGQAQLYPITYELSRLAGTLGHIGLLGLVWRGSASDAVGRGLEALGRLALTNYLTASIICAFLFNGFGFGLFGRFLTFELWGIAALILLAQAIMSFFWVQAFRHGPFEWLLRSIAHWKWQPFLLNGAATRRAPAPSAE